MRISSKILFPFSIKHFFEFHVKISAEPPQKVYSWDNKPTDNSEYLIENLSDQTVIKAPGEISGNQFMVRNCQNCCIYLFDHINTITVDDCKQCKIFIGPTKVNFNLFLGMC